MSKRTFKIYYCKNNPNPELAGKRYKPSEMDMLVMNAEGIFFVYNGEVYYPSITTLSNEIGNYDVVWNDE